MMRWALIFAAGGAGSVARYVMGGWAQRATPTVFPIGTLCVNVLGCLLIGFLAAALGGRWLVREEYRQMVIVGFLGGFTTFSAFGFETFSLLNEGQFARALANITLSLVLGLTAVWIGYRLAQHWLGA